MEELEKNLERLEFPDPPTWVKARAMLAAENVFARQARRSRVKTFAIAAVAVSASIAVVGTYIADAIAPVIKRSAPSSTYQPEESFEAMGGHSPLAVPRLAPARTRPAKDPTSEAEKEQKEQEKEKDEEDPREESQPRGNGKG